MRKIKKKKEKSQSSFLERSFHNQIVCIYVFFFIVSGFWWLWVYATGKKTPPYYLNCKQTIAKLDSQRKEEPPNSPYWINRSIKMVDKVIETLDKAVKSLDKEVSVVFSDVSPETISELVQA